MLRKSVATIIVLLVSIVATAYAPPHAAYGPEWVGYNDVIRIDIDTVCNVFAVTAGEYANYQEGRSFFYYGGEATSTPVYLTPPPGSYIIVIDNGGAGINNIRASVRIISNP